MSLITRCPACGTMFKVVADQLKVSQGWVRCGQCTDVFDASTHMVPEGEAVQAPPPAPRTPSTSQALPTSQAPPLQPVSDPSAVTPAGFQSAPSETLVPVPPISAPWQAPEHDDFDPARWKQDQQTRFRQDVPAFFAGQSTADQPPPRPQLMRTEAAADEVEGTSPNGARDEAAIPSPVVGGPEPAPLTPGSEDAGLDARDVQGLPVDPVLAASEAGEGEGASPQAARANQDDVDRDEEDADDEALHAAPDVSFVREARRQAFWKQRKVRAGLALLSLLLVAGLSFQWALHQRDTLAAQSPKLAPWLQTACGWLHCELRAPRHIESVVIDGSTFTKVGNDAYRLSFTLKNTSATLVHIPSLELTLTDAQDQPVVRRVLAPTQFGVSANVMPAQSELAGLVTLRVPPNGSRSGAPDGAASSSVSPASAAPLRVAGYRVLAFYPD